MRSESEQNKRPAQPRARPARDLRQTEQTYKQANRYVESVEWAGQRLPSARWSCRNVRDHVYELQRSAETVTDPRRCNCEHVVVRRPIASSVKLHTSGHMASGPCLSVATALSARPHQTRRSAGRHRSTLPQTTKKRTLKSRDPFESQMLCE